MAVRVSAALGLVALAVAILTLRFLMTEPGCSHESWSNWSGWPFVVGATLAFSLGVYVLVRAVTNRPSASLVAGFIAAIAGGAAIFVLALLDEWNGCIL